MPKQIITSSSTPTTGFTDKSTPSPLAQGIQWGKMLFLSGQGALDAEPREIVSKDNKRRQTESIYYCANRSFKYEASLQRFRVDIKKSGLIDKWIIN